MTGPNYEWVQGAIATRACPACLAMPGEPCRGGELPERYRDLGSIFVHLRRIPPKKAAREQEGAA